MIPELAVLSLLASPAGAGCLDETSLDKGIRVAFADGNALMVERHDGALLSLTYSGVPDGPSDPTDSATSLAWHGLFVTLRDSRAAEGFTMRYAAEFTETPPIPQAGQSGTLTTRPGDTPRVLLYGYSQAEPVLVGDCTYEILHVALTIPPLRGETVVGGHLYFPELGFGFPGSADEIVSIELRP